MKQLFILLFFLCTMNVSATEQVKENPSEAMTEENTSVKNSDGYSPAVGLKGFIEGGYTIGAGYSDVFRLALIATAGWQFNPNFFIGIGSGENYYTDSKQYAIPIYADFRINSKCLFLDLRAGYSISDIEGFYFSPSFGCRLGTKNNTAFTFSLGYEYQKSKTLIDGSYHASGLSTRIGFEF